MDRGDGLRDQALFETAVGKVIATRRQRGFDHLQRVESVGKKSVYDHGDLKPMYEARVQGVDDQRRVSVGR